MASVAPSPEPSSSEGSLPAPLPSSQPTFEEIVDVPSPVEVEDSGSDTEGGDDAASLSDQLDSLQDDKANGSEEEEDVDMLLDAVGSELKAKEEVHGWKELRKQIKDDILKAYRENKMCTWANQLTILRNFATLRIKGLGHINASKDVMWQWHEGEGIHFACRIHFLACHYQLFEQLPIEKQGGGRGHSLLNNEQIQVSVRAYLSSLAMGEVTPKRFQHTLNTQILPTLGYPPTKTLSEQMARRWLIKLEWWHTTLKKGVYTDGHERPDVIDYWVNTFLPLMAQLEKRMVHWVANGSELVHVDLKLGPDEKRVITVFQDESCFHVNEYKRDVWCTPRFSFLRVLS
jgi:hypothetical protein